MSLYQRLPAPDNRLYLGVGGSGKTTLALRHSFAFPRVVICNPNGEDAHQAGAVVIDDRGELVSWLAASGPVRVCWQGFDRQPREEAFAWVNRVAWAAGNVLVVWDEADLFMTAQRLPEEAYRLWNMGRHRSVRVFACSRRPARVSRDCTANLTRACVFRTQEPHDWRFLKDFMEPSAAAAARELPKYHAIDWTPAAWSVKKSPFP